MSYLPYIEDKYLIKHIDEVTDVAITAKNEAVAKFNSNVIDPFSALFEMGGFDLNHQTWYKSELARQAQKSVSNCVGLFHQKVLGCADGWIDLGTGSQVDLVNHEAKIIAEVKNKHNTVKGSDQKHVYYELADLVSRKASEYKGYTSYFVTIIPSRPIRFDKLFTPSDKERGSPCPADEKVRIIDGCSFYDMVTGHTDALKQLYKVLPTVINDRKKARKLSKNLISSKDLKELLTYFEAAFA